MCLFCFKSIGGPGQAQWPHQQGGKLHQMRQEQQWGHKFNLHNLSPSPPHSPEQQQSQQEHFLLGAAATTNGYGEPGIRKRKHPDNQRDDDKEHGSGGGKRLNPTMTATSAMVMSLEEHNNKSVNNPPSSLAIVDNNIITEKQQQQRHLALAQCLAAAVATAKMAKQKAAEAEEAAANFHLKFEEQQQQLQRCDEPVVVIDKLEPMFSALKRNRAATIASFKGLEPTKRPITVMVTSPDNVEEEEVQNKMQQRKNKKESSDELGSSLTGESGIECVICGAPASGMHYLVWSCNGCKTFFRRAIMENRKYSCKKNGNCSIDVRSRCSCRHCRFEKCLRVGMKFTEINIDRKRRIRGANSVDLDEIEVEHDPIVRELMTKEVQFRVLLSSCQTPIYRSLAKAIHAKPGAFDNFAMEQHEKNKFQENDSQLNFYDWRSRILSIIVDWIKSFPTFQGLSTADQEALIIHSAFPLLAFSEAFHTPERYTDRLVYPDGLQVTRNFSRGIYIERNGLNRAMVAIINDILTPIRRIQLTEIEYSFVQALILFDPDCLALSNEAVDIVTQKREQLLESLSKHLLEHLNGNRQDSAGRMAQLLLRIPRIHKVAEFKRQFFRENKVISQHQQDHSELAIAIAKQYPVNSFF